MTAMQTVVPVTESSQGSASRMAATELALKAGFDESDAHRAGIVATEMATNLFKHAPQGRGEILLRLVTGDSVPEIELIALDRGPGIRDLGASLNDGFSTAGTSGAGLGAIRRLSDEFDIHSVPGKGTTVMARLRARRGAAERPPLIQIGAVSLAKDGETVSGDAWSVKYRTDGASLLVADGLGHGLHAADASQAAVASFMAKPFKEPSEGLERMHDAIRHTRGAAATIVDIRAAQRTMRMAGVGNVSTAISRPERTNQAVSHNGTLGHQARYFKDYGYPWDSQALLIMHSDGLATHWALESYPGLRLKHPSIIAATLYRDFTRGRDDVTVVVGRERP